MTMKKDHLEILLEDMNGKLDLVLEGHAVLAEKIDRLARDTDERFKLVDLKFDALNDKIDAVAADLRAHRADTEAHHGIYRVKE
jgi:hypothetical protein